MQKRAIVYVILVLLCLGNPPLRAWNDCGHMLIALLAYRQLDHSQKAKVAEILAQHPHYESFLTGNKPRGVSAEEWAFLRAATWPDYVRGPDHRANFHRARWHYINLPYVPESETPHLTGPKFETPTINVLVSIDECRDLLSEEYPSAARKAVHLAWLEHLIGDIHQPLHCITLVHRKYPRGDLGGNLLAVRTKDVVKRLHAYWDDALGSDTTYAWLSGVADELAADRSLARSAFPELATHTTPRSWADEGYALGKEYVYLYGTLPLADYDAYDKNQLSADQVPLLPDEYERNARQLARRRAALASYRLAHAIQEALFK
jgi:hypothetical protein